MRHPYEIRIYRWKPMGDWRYDDPAHKLHKTHSLKVKGFHPYIVARGVPAVDITYSRRLDSIGQAQVTIPLDGPEEWRPTLGRLADIEPYRYCLGIVRTSEDPGSGREESQLVWAGIIWSMRMDLETRVLQLSARDWLSFWENRHHTGRITDIEQAEIIRQVVLSGNRNWGINTETDAAATGRTRDWQAGPGEWREVASDLYDMADDLSGFFLTVDSRIVNEGTEDEHLRHVVRSTKDRTPVWAAVPSLKDRINCEIPEIYFDGSQVTNVSYAIGRSGNLPVRRRRDNTLLRREVPVRDVVGRYDSVGDSRVLDSRAETQLAFGARGIRVPRIITYPNAYPDPQLLDPNLGIKVRVEADTGFLTVEEPFVVTEARVQVEGDGSDRCELTLVQETLFQKGKWE
ncbi:hypothetical protein ABZ714_13250 [Streptomyces sp. NPDC006798]|uniref:hypothetical protein n=1 Tax=Streptomyces sp. NPDC006798 TaxID=3155462 RepID=UPI0033C96BEF